MQTGHDPVYVCLQGPSGNHALWAYALEIEDGYCDIYVYDCIWPDYPQIIRLYGNNHSFSGFQYINPDNTYSFTDISFGSLLVQDSLTLYLLPYNCWLSTEKGE